MARFCAECGAPLDDAARFCGECGAPVEGAAPAAAPVENTAPATAPESIPEVPLEAPAAEETAAPEYGAETTYAQEEAPAAEEAPQWTEPQPAAPVQPRVKKPLPKWAKPAIIAVAAVVVVLVALSLILNGINDPEKVADKFLDAMANSDFAAFSKVAVAADEDLVLTEDNTAPLFKLYNDSISFRKSVEDLLDEDIDLIEDGDDPNEGYLFDLRAEKKFLHTAYKVVIETCDTLEIGSNLACDVKLDGGQSLTMTADSNVGDPSLVYSADYARTEYCTGNLYDVLPGLYTVTGTVETANGTTFNAEATVEVANEYNAYAELNFDYVTLEIANDYDIPVEFYVDGNLYGSLEGEGYFEAGPLLPDQMIEARADVGTDEPMTETFSASEGYWELPFVLCEVEIYNDYAVPIQVLRDGEVILEVAPGDYDYVSNLPSGTVLTMQLADGLTDPVEYTCEYEYDYIYPEFQVAEGAQLDCDKAVADYVQAVLDALNAGDTAALDALAETTLKEEMTNVMMVHSEDAEVFISLNSIEYNSDDPWDYYIEPGPDENTVIYYCDVKMGITSSGAQEDGEEETMSYNYDCMDYPFLLLYEDNTWSVIG